MPVQETQSGSVTAVNTFGVDGLVSRDSTAQGDVFYQFDDRGNTTTRFNSSGTVLDYHGSEAYGVQFSTGGSPDPYMGFGAQGDVPKIVEGCIQ